VTKEKYKILDLFSGIGGFSLGLERTGHFETTAFCEIDKFCKLILDKHWKGTKIYDNVKEITKERLEADGIEFPDIITGGFPCQSFSVAGKQKGTSDSRYLWPEMFRIIKIFKPRYVIGENVRGIVNIENGMVFETVCSNLEDEGYEVQPFLIPAASVGAPHRRERIWFIASLVNTEHDGLSTSKIEGSSVASSDNNEKGQNETSEFKGTGGSRDSKDVANTKSERLQRSRGQESDRDINRFQQDKKRIESEIRSESERRSRTFTDENVENSRRTLQQGTELRETNEDEIRKEDANQHQRSGSPSESDVANADTRLGNGENEEIQARGKTSNFSSSRTGTNGQSWWLVEPNVGRVAHGVSGRVHRLKALGNSIVPQIVEEIGRAIIEAERTE